MYETRELKALRNKNHYTIYDMANMLNISSSHYSLLENKKRNLSYEMAIKIANIFNTNPDEIFLKKKTF
ncbi:MAG: helix-turn-helix transcriptional regulator [Bacilli bacterium]|nr:helix-turn-helix transcriptional regulator [Bacilli bacterium]